jgi:hypothetical protein
MVPAGRPARPQRPQVVAADPHRRPIACRACVVAGTLAAEAVAGHWRPLLGAALAVADVTIAAVIILALLISILCGSTETCERAFRLLRWASGRAEPPAPRQSEPTGQIGD